MEVDEQVAPAVDGAAVLRGHEKLRPRSCAVHVGLLNSPPLSPRPLPLLKFPAAALPVLLDPVATAPKCSLAAFPRA
jgi:hypothetical protein